MLTIFTKLQIRFMNIPDKIKKILEYAIMAPSGDNCQPWRFSYSENKLDIFNDPKSDFSLYSWGQRASFLSHGALLQNIVLSSPSLGYNSRIQFFPDRNNENHVARIIFEKILDRKNDTILLSISRRVTNRKIYYSKKLSDSDRISILNQSEELTKFVNLTLIEDLIKIKNIANAVSINEQILFENKKMHSFFYSHINWTSKEDKMKKKGFYIKTLELSGPAIVPFKLFRNWAIFNFVNKLFGFSKILAKKNSLIYTSGAAMGVISIPSEEPIDYIRAGMLFQNIWLTATSLELSLQPLTGILFLNLILRHSSQNFSTEHCVLIKKEYDIIKENAGVAKSENIVIVFRVGYSDPPSAKANRHSIDHFLIQS